MERNTTSSVSIVWRVIMTLNSNHNITYPIQKKAFNKFREHGISKRRGLQIFTENGERYSSTMTMQPRRASLGPKTKKKDDVLLIHNLSNKSTKTLSALIGTRGKNIKRIVGSTNINGMLIIEQTKPHKKSKCKEFAEVKHCWNNNKANESNEPQQIIANQILEKEAKEVEFSKSKQDNPMVVLRGKKKEVRMAQSAVSQLINNAMYISGKGIWLNLRLPDVKYQEDVVELTNSFCNIIPGISHCWYVATQRDKNSLKMNRKFIPQDVKLPFLFLNGAMNALNIALEILKLNKIEFVQVFTQRGFTDADAENGDLGLSKFEITYI
eukprot:592047_1